MIEPNEIQTKYPGLYAYTKGQGKFLGCEPEPYTLTFHGPEYIYREARDRWLDPINQANLSRAEVFSLLGFEPGIKQIFLEYRQLSWEWYGLVLYIIPHYFFFRMFGISLFLASMNRLESVDKRLFSLRKELTCGLKFAAAADHLSMMKRLIQYVGIKQLLESPDRSSILRIAIIQKQANIVQYLLSFSIFSSQNKYIQSISTFSFQKAQSPLSLAIETHQPDMAGLLLSRGNFSVFEYQEALGYAAMEGELGLFQGILKKLKPKYLQKIARTQNMITRWGPDHVVPDPFLTVLDQVYENAAAFGHIDILQAMKTADYRVAKVENPLKEAIVHHQLESLRWFFETERVEVDDDLIKFAIAHGNGPCADYIISRFHPVEMPRYLWFSCLIDALKASNPEILKMLLEKKAPIQKDVSESDQDKLLEAALLGGCKASLDLVWQHFPQTETKTAKILNGKESECFNNLARTGDIEMYHWFTSLQYLRQWFFPRQKVAALWTALKSSHWHLADKMLEDRIVISGLESETYQQIYNYRTDVSELFSHVTSKHRSKASQNYSDIQGEAIVFRLMLHSSALLDWVELHHHEYGTLYTTPFVQKTLVSWRARDLAEAPLTPHEAKIGYYMLRHLFRLPTSEESSASIHFLLAQPDIRAELVLTPTRVQEWRDLSTPEIRLYMRQTFPDIRGAMEAADRIEPNENSINTGPESSLRALTAHERKQLKRAFDHYKISPDDLISIKPPLKQMREELASRYEKAPATVYLRGEVVRLPCQWEAFKSLTIKKKQLTSEERALALKAYYRHETHGALRYISEPNRWIYESAGFIDRGRMRAKYDGYEPTIVMLWRAASDSEPAMAPAESKDDKRSVAERIEDRSVLYLQELYRANRSHNYDASEFHERVVTDSISGRELYFESPEVSVASGRRDYYCWHQDKLSYVQRDGQIITPTITYPQIFKTFAAKQKGPMHLSAAEIEQYITDNGGHVPEYQPILDEKGNIRTEQYDDLKADDPSCYSGMPSRLMQAVLFHPKINPGEMLTKASLEQDSRSFMRKHFKALINEDNYQTLEQALAAAVVDTEDEQVLETLKILDVSPAQQTEFEQQLRNKYGDDQVDDYKENLDKRFSIKDTRVHALQFYEDCKDALDKMRLKVARPKQSIFPEGEEKQGESEVINNERGLGNNGQM